MFPNFSTRLLMAFSDFLYNQRYMKLGTECLELRMARHRSAFYRKPHNSLEPHQCYFRLNLSNMSSLDWHTVYSHSKTFWYDGHYPSTIFPFYPPRPNKVWNIIFQTLVLYKWQNLNKWSASLLFAIPERKADIFFIRSYFSYRVAIVATESILALAGTIIPFCHWFPPAGKYSDADYFLLYQQINSTDFHLIFSVSCTLFGLRLNSRNHFRLGKDDNFHFGRPNKTSFKALRRLKFTYQNIDV